MLSRERGVVHDPISDAGSWLYYIGYYKMTSPSEWYKDEFFVSTQASLIQPNAVNTAFASGLMYWARAINDEKLLKTMLDNSLCFGVYQMPTSSSEIAGKCSCSSNFVGGLTVI
jgi:hypothetical protein